jgi:hypothetical protein
LRLQAIGFIVGGELVVQIDWLNFGRQIVERLDRCAFVEIFFLEYRDRGFVAFEFLGIHGEIDAPAMSVVEALGADRSNETKRQPDPHDDAKNPRIGRLAYSNNERSVESMIQSK